LPPGPWATVLDCLADAFPRVDRATWHQRMAAGRVIGDDGSPIAADAPYRVGTRLSYFREVPAEPVLPFDEAIVYQDERLLVVDKPHFLPVVPAGRFVRQCLLHRLVERTGIEALAPLHRIDRLTAGLVMFSVRQEDRHAWTELFRGHHVLKHYEAVAPALPGTALPLEVATRIEAGEPFFRMRQVAGPANAFTTIRAIVTGGERWLYQLAPRTGRKHQLRVQMAALGAPIQNDPWYPELGPDADDYEHPLQLLARSLAFVDPFTGERRRFKSGLSLKLDPRGRTLEGPPSPSSP
jgi:tRNA pseudouridine32 synthase/23S rRNA pseudouridine746 synthase